MEAKDKILESDLWKPVSDFFVKEGYTVRSEVKDCDIAAIKGEELVVIELKKNLSVDLLAQAAKRQKAADLVYIAVPKPKKLIGNAKWKDICHLIRRLELGLILVSIKGRQSFIEIPIHPIPFDREKSRNMSKKKRESIIKEASSRYKDSNIGGSTGKKLVTAYKECAIFIACCLQKFGPLSPKKLREFGADEKKTTSILSENHYGWFKRIDRGVYSITEVGVRELTQYKELTEYYNSKIVDL
ncbi:DUF2161 family putative PD-(D/E)XK-type phosphodiesterase [Clostridium swellfunianum]|uniref:DUF2161 family putative PD-(D/E)XK-type phosphodiesterase n=1 Tax=Clostridium swellfunianum TaxID=1367462 RepID=UPI00202DC5DF|nr:DUF2161 family putative PD-(D/E)XK-type phosphodiesterase [Clostridium swellfunianum]MCM0649089.1 DUF2161 family putative PD-(D/E)XK-type phosphodiesterase [Clostridium swellfunianum]